MALQWLTLVAAIWLQSINGTNSTFPAYSSQLKRILSVSQLKLNNLASANDAGKLFGWISGLAAAHFPLWLVLLIGALLGLVGYGLQFLFLTDQLSSLSYWHIFFLTVLAGNGICWINTVCYIITINNFPLDRQIAVGLSTSYVGLSAKIYTDIVDVAAPTSPSERAKVFLLLNSVLPLLVCIVVSPLARDVSVGKSKKLTRGFFTMFVISVITGVFAVATSFRKVVAAILPSYMVLAGMVVVLFLPLIVPVAEKIAETLQQKCLIAVHADAGFITCSDEKAASKDLESGRNVLEAAAGVVEGVGPLLMLRRAEFWLYFFVYLFGGTLGLVFANNLAQIAESRGCSGTSSLVSLSSAFSFFGRLLPSFPDYFWPRSKRLLTRAGAMGDDGSNVRGFLLAVEPERHLTLCRYGHYRHRHGRDYIHLRVDNGGAVRDEEFRSEPQYCSVKYTNRVILVWRFCCSCVQQSKKWPCFIRKGGYLHGPKLLSDNFYFVGLFVCFWDSLSFYSSFTAQETMVA